MLHRTYSKILHYLSRSHRETETATNELVGDDRNKVFNQPTSQDLTQGIKEIVLETDECSIQVRNIRNLSSPEVLLHYLKDQNPSHGGAVSELVFRTNCDNAVATFESASIAEKVLMKAEHTLEGQTIYISKLPPLCKNRFYVENAPPWVPDDCLKYCIESVSNSEEVERLIYCEDRKRLLVCFKNEINIENLRNEIKAYPLRHLYEAEIFSISLPDAILLYGNVPPSDDSIILAFEDFLAGHPDVSCPNVRHVISNDDKSLTIVVFEDYKAVSCLKNFISINGQQFSITPFYDCLGWMQLTDSDAKFLLECSFEKVRRNLSQLQIDFLAKQVGYDYVVNQLENQNYHCQFEISTKEQCLLLMAPTKDLRETCANFILSCLTSFEIDLDSSNLKLLREQCSKFTDLIDETDVKQWFCFNVKEDINKLCVVVASTDNEYVKNLIHGFFKEYSIYTEIVVDAKIRGMYLKKYYGRMLLKANFGNNLLINFLPDGQISATGTKSEICKLKEVVQGVMLAAVEVAICTLQQSNWLNIFHNGHGLKEINAIASETSTVIQSEIMWPIEGYVTATRPKLVDVENYICALPSVVARKLLSAPVNQPLCINGCDINIVQGDIINLANQYDVIVTSLAPNSLLQDGSRLSRTIAQAAGSTYIHDVNRECPNGIVNEIVAFTRAGQLGCKYVFHVTCPVWNTVSGLNDLSQRITVCMNDMVAKKVKSIAFPAIGTGGFKYPADVVAKAMFAAVENSLKSNANQSMIRSVSFILLPCHTTILESFQREFELCLNRSGLLSSVAPVPLAKTAVFEIGPLTVEIIEGNLEDQDTDCIISMIKEDFVDNLCEKSQLPDALKIEGGELLAHVLRQYTKLSFKNRLLTVYTGGVLHFKTVIFLEDFLVTNLIEWRYCFFHALKAANNRGLFSVATPLIQMRMANCTLTKCVEMLRAIQIYACTVRKSDLRLIRFVVSQNETLLEFCKEVADLIEDEKTRFPVNSHVETFDWLLKRFNGIGLVKNIVNNEEKSPLTFSICGPVSGIQQAQTLLRKAYGVECPERRIIKDVIASLNDEMIFKLEMKAEKHGVKMYTDRTISTITVKGRHAVEFQEFLTEFLEKFADETSDITVKWYKREDHRSSWQLTNLRTAQLEKEFNKLSGKGRILFEFDCGVLRVDFNQMVILTEDTKRILYDLKRKELTDVTPVEWTWDWSIKNSDPYKLVRLEKDSPEYVTVRDAIQQTAPNVRIIKIERVENPAKYKQYIALKQQMEQSTPSSVQIERKLFHGTNLKNVPCICSTGFNRSLCGHNGTLYGSGTYFARDFLMGCRYGSSVIYANVLTGIFTVGNPNMKAAPLRDPSKGVEFDSVVDKVADPRIFVVFSDNHAYPSYLITY